MKARLLLVLLALIVAAHAAEPPLPIDEPGAKRTITFAAEGEDATSGSYYFFYALRDSEEVAKVRLVWNGGATDAPTVTDYYLNAAFILIVERSAERALLPALVKGKDVAFKTTRQRLIKTVSPDREHLYSLPSAELIARGSDAEREQMTTLVSLLALQRKPLPK